MKIIALQLDSTVGDIEGNVDKALELINAAADSPTIPDLAVLPPHFVSGYPLLGLAQSETFLDKVSCAYADLAKSSPVPILTLAHVKTEDPDWPSQVYLVEAICLLSKDGGVQVLCELDDEDGLCDIAQVEIAETKIDVVVGDVSDFDPADFSASAIVNLVDTTYDILRPEICSGEILTRCCALAREKNAWLVRLGSVGSQDSLVFPGAGAVITPEGELAGDSVLFDEAIYSVSFDPTVAEDAAWESEIEELDDREFGFAVRMDLEGIDDEAADWNAIVCSVADYVSKNGFSDVVVGLSGGIDSSLVATISVDALGPEHVHGVLMPSMYSSESSITDAMELASRLGISTVQIPIIEPFDAFESALSKAFEAEVEGLVRENIQSRIRTIYLMATSNKYGWMLLNTGNKSEAAMGYSTLYGDTAGAYAPLANVYKTRLYELARWRNEQSELIPINVLEKAPSAELRPGQKDQDSLPPYETLDAICSLYLEYGYSPQAIVDEGFDADTVNKVLSSIAANEYKRACEPIGPIIDGVSLTEDRQWPITNAFRDKVN